MFALQKHRADMYDLDAITRVGIQAAKNSPRTTGATQPLSRKQSTQYGTRVFNLVFRRHVEDKVEQVFFSNYNRGNYSVSVNAQFIVCASGCHCTVWSMEVEMPVHICKF